MLVVVVVVVVGSAMPYAKTGSRPGNDAAYELTVVGVMVADVAADDDDSKGGAEEEGRGIDDETAPAAAATTGNEASEAMTGE